MPSGGEVCGQCLQPLPQPCCLPAALAESWLLLQDSPGLGGIIPQLDGWEREG